MWDKWKNKWSLSKFIKEVLTGIILIFIFLNIISYIRQPELSSTTVPNLDVTLVDGSTFVYDKQKPLLIHFWATWCSTCRFEASSIERLSHDYQVLSVAVSSGSDTHLSAFMQAHNLSYPVLNDAEANWVKRFNITAFPSSFIYNAQGDLSFSEVGYTSTVGLYARMKLAE